MNYSSMLGSQSNPALLPSNNQLLGSRGNYMQTSASSNNIRLNFETISIIYINI